MRLLFVLLVLASDVCSNSPSTNYQKKSIKHEHLVSRQVESEPNFHNPDEFNDDRNRKILSSFFPPKYNIIYCTTQAAEMIRASVHEAILMLQTAAGRLQTLEIYLQQEVVRPIWEQNAVLASTFRTFSALIKRDWYTSGPAWDYFRRQTCQAVRRQKRLADTIAEALLNQKYQIACSEDWIENRIDSSDGRLYAIDKRPGLSEWQGQSPEVSAYEFMFKGENGENSSTLAYTINRQLEPYPTVIVLKPDHFSKWKLPRELPNGQILESFRNMSSRTYPQESWWLSQFGPYLTSVLIHEFSHSRWILGNQRLLDVNVSGYCEWEGATCYNWDGVVGIAKQNTKLAQKNAQSFMFLIMALYFDKEDFSLGSNRALWKARFS